MSDIYIKPSMEIDCFEIEDIITLSAGGGYGGEDQSSESSTGTGETEAPTDQEPGEITGGAGFDSDIMGGNEFQEMLENLYQNFIKFI